MEALARDKSVCDEALIKILTDVDLGDSSKEIFRGFGVLRYFGDYYREYDVQSRLASLKSVMMEVEDNRLVGSNKTAERFVRRPVSKCEEGGGCSGAKEDIGIHKNP